MQKFGRGVVKLRVPILIVSVLLLIPSIFGFVSTRINYDILSYLPSDIETMKGQDIMLDEFGKGGFSLVMLDAVSYTHLDVYKRQEYKELLSYSSQDNFSEFAKTREDMSLVMNIYNIVTKTEKSYDERISQLQAKVKELEEQTSGSGKTITADETGYFVSYADCLLYTSRCV